MTWTSEEPAPLGKVPRLAWPRIFIRGLMLGILIFGGLLIKAIVRLVERPLCGLRRPVSPYLTQAVCRAALWVVGLQLRVKGRPMIERGALVANHSSWLDIFVLNSAARVYFVSKAEVAQWPGIGLLARATGTVFIRRDRRDARRQKMIFEARLRAGHRLLFFPEGTSTDNRQVLPFKSALFEAFLTPELRDFLQLQPVSVVYHAPKGSDPRFYGWWGDMEFVAHLLRVLGQPAPGQVDIVFHAPLRAATLPSRKALAQSCESAVRAGFEARR